MSYANKKQEPLAFTWPAASKGFCDFNENIILAYGIPKIGKTTFFASIPDTIFLSTEPGTKHVSVREWEIRTWIQFVAAVTQLVSGAKAGESPFIGVCIDTVDNLGDYCIDFVCTKKGISDLSEGAFGSAYAAVTKEFKKQVNRLIAAGYAVYFTSHAERKEVEVDQVTNPYGAFRSDQMSGKRDMIVPTASKRVRKFILGLSDLILYFEMDKTQARVIRCQPTLYYEAGDRSGRLGQTLPLSYDAVIEKYYESNEEDLSERIKAIEESLSKLNVEFEPYDGDGTISTLQNYLHHLRIKLNAAEEADKETRAAQELAEQKECDKLIKAIEVNEAYHYPVKKAVDAARSKHYGKVVLDASPKELSDYLTYLEDKTNTEIEKVVPLCEKLEQIMEIPEADVKKVRKAILGKQELKAPLQLDKLRSYHERLIFKHQTMGDSKSA